MKKKETQMIFILIIISILIIGVIWIITKGGKKEEAVSTNLEQNIVTEEFVQELEDGTKLNTSSTLKKEKQFQGLKITNIQLTNQNNKTELIADIENSTGKDTQAMLIYIILYDKEGNEITTLGGRISPIKAGKTMQFSTSAMIDYANACDFEFKLK